MKAEKFIEEKLNITGKFNVSLDEEFEFSKFTQALFKESTINETLKENKIGYRMNNLVFNFTH